MGTPSLVRGPIKKKKVERDQGLNGSTMAAEAKQIWPAMVELSPK